MRIIVADYTGHAFPVTLSRELAARGHDVLHLFSSSFQTPKGELERRATDPVNLEICGLRLEEPFDKDNLFKRRRQEGEIGKKFAEAITRFAPDITILSNFPMDAMARCQPAIRRTGSKFVFWVQDLVGEAVTRLLSQRLGIAGRLVGAYYARREAGLLRNADHIVAISDDFVPILTDKIGIARDRITVVENWSPIADVPLHARDNAWATANLPDTPVRIMYSGTLGMKHDPEALLALAEHIEGSHVLIFSEGAVAEQVASDAKRRGVTNLSVRNWLDFGDLPAALAGADLLVVLLEPDAAVFSVPSKVLTYLCAQRPILGAIPKENLAARIIERTGAGIVCHPGDHDAMIAAARRLIGDRQAAAAAGMAARRYAEETFDIQTITTRFEQILSAL